MEQELQSAYKRGEFITNPNAPVVMDKDGQVTQPIETTPQTKDGRTRQEEKGSYENYPDSGQASPKKQSSILDGVPQVQKQEDNALREKLEKSARIADTLAAEAVPDRGGQHDAQTRGAMAQVMRRAMMELSVGNEETQKASGLYNEFVTDNLVRPRGNTENDAIFDNMMSQVRKRLESNNASQQDEDVGDIIKQEVGNFFSKFRFGR